MSRGQRPPAGAGRDQAAVVAVFGRFAAAVRPLAAAVPGLVFGGGSDTQIEFTFLGQANRIRLACRPAAGGGAGGVITRLYQPAPGAEDFVATHVLLVDPAGGLRLPGGRAFGHSLPEDSERVFFYLLTGV